MNSWNFTHLIIYLFICTVIGHHIGFISLFWFEKVFLAWCCIFFIKCRRVWDLLPYLSGWEGTFSEKHKWDVSSVSSSQTPPAACLREPELLPLRCWWVCDTQTTHCTAADEISSSLTGIALRLKRLLCLERRLDRIVPSGDGMVFPPNRILRLAVFLWSFVLCETLGFDGS